MQCRLQPSASLPMHMATYWHELVVGTGWGMVEASWQAWHVLWYGVEVSRGALEPGSRESMGTLTTLPLYRNPTSLFLEKLNSTRITDSIFGSSFHDKALVPLRPPFITVERLGI